jgi:PAS domain S-box-containing protein
MGSNALREILKARGFNKIIIALIILPLAFLIIIASLLIRPVVSPDTQILSTISFAFYFLIGIPLALYLYVTGRDKEQNAVFFSTFLSICLLLTAAFIWFFLPQILDYPWLVPAGKLFALTVYVPVLVTFYLIFKGREKRAAGRFNDFLLIFYVISGIAILLFVAMNFSEGRSDTLSVLIYTVSILLDIIGLALGSMLAITSMDNEFRYVMAIPLGIFFFSLGGDAMLLLEYLGMYRTFGYGELFFDGQAIYTAIALLTFALGNIKVTTVEEVNKKLYDTKSLMSNLVMQSPVAVCIFDIGGRVVLANPMFLKFTGLGQDEIKEKLNLYVDAERIIKGSSETIARIKKGEIDFYNGIIKIPSADAREIYYSANLFPARDADGVVTSYIVILVDITESMRNKEELQMAKDEAELYLDLMSHDINNMDQIAMGFLEMALSRPGLDGETREMIARPLEALESSTNLIRNVKKLQLVRGNGHKLQVVDLADILHEVLPRYASIPGREVMIIEHFDTDCLVQANGLLSDVFSNIIGNAVKHSHDGLTINVDLDRVEENGRKYCRVRIEDDGPGIPDDRKGYVFNGFHKGSARASGKGLGLYLVKTLLEIFQGEIWLEDRVRGDFSQGSRFVVLIPAIEQLTSR